MPMQSRTTMLLATDQQQSVLKTLDASEACSIAYTPYGHRPPGDGLCSVLGFNGELPDPLTGHYHLGKGYRQFNPVLMRFNSPDSWSPFGEGGLNAYGYCGADPVNRTDPSGHRFTMTTLIKKMNENAFKHHQGPATISDSTIRAMKTTVRELGGKSKIKSLARKAKTKTKSYVLEQTILRKTRDTPALSNDANPVQNIINMQNIIAYRNELRNMHIDIAVGTRKGEFRPAGLKNMQGENELAIKSMEFELAQAQQQLKNIRQTYS